MTAEWDEIGPTAYLVDRLQAQARGETIDQEAVGEAAQAAAIVMFVNQGLELDQAIETVVGRDCRVNVSLNAEGTLAIELEWPDPPSITDIHQLIAETLAAGGPVADELDAASEILDALHSAGVTLHHTNGVIEWPDADYPEDRDVRGLAELYPTLAARRIEEEDRCRHCGSRPDDPTVHQDGCVTLDTCAQCEPDLDEPWHPETDWWDEASGESYAEAFRRHLREAHGGR